MRCQIAFLVGVALAAPLGMRLSGLLFNCTNSVPIGLYRKSENPTAPYAGFCLAQPTVYAALRAGLEITAGDCPGGVAPILKPLVYPSAEHPLTLSARGFFFEGKLLANTEPKTHSKTGAVLQHYPFGVYATGAWAVSDFNRVASIPGTSDRWL